MARSAPLRQRITRAEGASVLCIQPQGGTATSAAIALRDLLSEKKTTDYADHRSQIKTRKKDKREKILLRVLRVLRGETLLPLSHRSSRSVAAIREPTQTEPREADPLVRALSS